MKYNIESVLKTEDKNEYLFFWGHQQAKDGSISKSCFSQWWASTFIVEEIQYKTAEHWMMAKKALLFNDTYAFEKILAGGYPADVKKAGREVKNYKEEEWIKHRYKIVQEGNYHKFSQDKQLKKFLLDTGDKIIVEASPVDSIWGIGMAEDHAEVLQPGKWKGLNLLGFALMEVRDLIKNK